MLPVRPRLSFFRAQRAGRVLVGALLLAGCRYRYERVSLGRDSATGEAGGVASSGSGAPSTQAGAADGGSAGAAGSPSVTGPIAYWPLDETSGVTARDATLNHNDGALTGFSTPGWTAGKTGGGLAFSNGPYIEVQPSPSIDAIADNDALTVGAWLKSSEQGSWFESVLSVQFEDSDWETFGLYLNQGIVIMVVNTGIGVGECNGTNAIPLDTWVHLAGTFDGSVVRAYVNGVEECSLVPGELDIPRSLNPLLIGSNQNRAAPGEFMRGALDEIVLYDHALGGDKIAMLSAGGLP